jgi:hypothetical protein
LSATNVGRWDAYHRDRAPAPYADTVTYELGVRWLQPCAQVEDWGCGLGWARLYFRPERYRGIDGSQGPAVDEVVDLATYRSQVEGIFMRHVLEHNPDWAKVLDNALASFTKRMALILFTPIVEETRQIAWNAGYEVPDISFAPQDLESRFPEGVDFQVEDLSTPSLYGVERVYYLKKGR